jgi:large subunit ribosomal protein L15
MAVRKQKQKKGYLGHRSHGRGNVKNRRGSGNRGGRGNAGMDKHKWSLASKLRTNKDKAVYFFKCGFTRPNSEETHEINLFQINQQAILGKLPQKEGKPSFEFKGKVLGTGSVSAPLSVKAYSWSKAVERKLKEAGGEISKLDA